MVKKRVRDIKRRTEELEKTARVIQQNNGRLPKRTPKRPASSVDEFASQASFIKVPDTDDADNDNTELGVPPAKKAALVSKAKKATKKTTAGAAENDADADEIDFESLQKAVIEQQNAFGSSSDEDGEDQDSEEEGVVGKGKGEKQSIQRDFTLDSATLAAATSKAKKAAETPAAQKQSSIIYLGHIPHGFFEPQMKEFFSQFGVVKNCRLFRNRKTGHSRQFAFIQFEDSEVAKIVAETMNGYIMFSRTLRCQVVPRDKTNFSLWIRPSRRLLYRNTRPQAIQKHNSIKTEKTIKKKQKTIVKKLEQKKKKLADIGINYELPSVNNVAEPAPAKAQPQAQPEVKDASKKGKKAESKVAVVEEAKKAETKKAETKVAAPAVVVEEVKKKEEPKKAAKKEEAKAAPAATVVEEVKKPEAKKTTKKEETKAAPVAAPNPAPVVVEEVKKKEEPKKKQEPAKEAKKDVQPETPKASGKAAAKGKAKK